MKHTTSTCKMCGTDTRHKERYERDYCSTKCRSAMYRFTKRTCAYCGEQYRNTSDLTKVMSKEGEYVEKRCCHSCLRFFHNNELVGEEFVHQLFKLEDHLLRAAGDEDKVMTRLTEKMMLEPYPHKVRMIAKEILDARAKLMFRAAVVTFNYETVQNKEE